MRTLREPRRFWWDRERPVDAQVCPLRAVIFDGLHALGEIDRDGDVTPRPGLIDLVMSLFVAGIWVGVVSTGRRDRVEPAVRQLVGDGLVETIVTGDDLDDTVARSARHPELHRLALWELGVTPEHALAVVGSPRGLRAAALAGLPALAVAPGYRAGPRFADAAAVRCGYEASPDGVGPLLAAGCQQLRRRLSAAKLAALVA